MWFFYFFKKRNSIINPPTEGLGILYCPEIKNITPVKTIELICHE